jgi:type II secretory pathway pseudopilin PulG
MTPRSIQRFWHRIRYAVRDQGRDEGFTLLEAVVSFALFAFVIAGATTGIVSSLKASQGSQQRVGAANAAQFYVDQARSDSTLPVKYPDHTYTSSVGKESYTVERSFSFDAGATQCGTGVTYVVHVKVWAAGISTATIPLARSDARISC